MAGKVRLSRSGMRELMNDDGVRADLTRRAERVLAVAKADPHDDTGAYEAGLRVEQDTTDRAAVRVVSGDSKGHVLEARYGILARALDAAGGA